MSFLKRKNSKQEMNKIPHVTLKTQEQRDVNGELVGTVDFIKSVLGDNSDLVIREFTIFGKHSAALFYNSNLVVQSAINNEVLTSFSRSLHFYKW